MRVNVLATVIAEKRYMLMFMVCVLVVIASVIIQKIMMTENVYHVNRGVSVMRWIAKLWKLYVEWLFKEHEKNKNKK